MISKLDHNQKSTIKIDLDNFLQNFIVTNCQLKYIIGEASINITKIISELIHLIEKTFNSSDIAVAFEDKNLKNIHPVIQQNKIEFEKIYLYYNYKFDELFALKDFKNGLNKHYNRLICEEKDMFFKLIKDNEHKINNLLQIRNLSISEKWT